VITSPKQDTGQVTANEQNLRMLINNLDEPIWYVDASCSIVECNKAFKKWVSYFIGAELDKGDNVLYDGQDKIYQEKFEMCYRLALNGRAFKSVEDMKIGAETRYTHVTFNPVFDSEATVIGVSCFARDITEQRKHVLRIEEQNTALREIAFIESHKVRGPVATILGLEQLFNYDDFSDPINKIIIEGISKTTKDLDEIVKEVVHKSNQIGLQP
jgi:PAS domain S-box-containing protein